MNVPSAELVARYRTRAPRYTSYPAAPHFGALSVEELDAGLARAGGPLSVYVHIPFCLQLCHYCGCHVEIHHNKDIGEGYVDTLLDEAQLWQARTPARGSAQLALGGGTPTFLRPDQMQRLIEGLQHIFPWTADIDASIEIDPRSVDDAYLRTLVKLGFNRFSFGVQDLDPEVLAAVNRPQTDAMVSRCTEVLRAAAPASNLNFDLMYGLPHQDEASFGRTLERVVALRPTRIALFHYAHVPWLKPAQKLVERQGLPPSELKARLFELATQRLGAAGYAIIGMDHFAIPGDELLEAQQRGDLQRNFMGYTTRASLDQIGLGVSSIGSFSGVYAQNVKDRQAWTELVETGRLPVERGKVLSQEDAARKKVIMQLFCNFSATLDAAATIHFASELRRLQPMAADGLLVITPQAGTTLQVTPLGRHFIRNVCAVFDQYLEEDQGTRRYSMTA